MIRERARVIARGAVIQSLESSFLDPIGYDQFELREREEGGEKTALLLPDIATCGDCLREIFDRSDRRFRYPFMNCTNCGPRFSIIEALPYARANTSMKSFTMCADCDGEHDALERLRGIADVFLVHNRPHHGRA
jgi:hydrogenase maturation protein HypF